MTHRPITRLLTLLAVCSLAACHGGARSAVPKPSATPTLAPGCKVVSPQSTGSTYTLTSSPSGLSVQRSDATSASCIYFFGTTQTTDTPPTAPHAWNYIFTPSVANPYTVPVTQTLNGTHTIFYNQAGDSSGTVLASSLQSVARSSASSARRVAETSRGIQRFTGAGVVPDQVLVRYRGSAAQMRSRASQIERAEGAGAMGPELTAPSGEYERFVHVPAGTDATAFAATLRSQRDVAGVYAVHKRFPLSKPPMAVSDPHANNVDQWYLFADGFPNAWSYTHGTNIKLAVIDTGVDLNNTDLTQNLVFSTGYETTNHTAQDTNGHGTNVTGIAAAITNNALGFAGGGYDVKLYAYNIFPDATASSHDQTATVTDEVNAINDAVTKGVDVINLSLGAAEDYSPNNGYDQGEHDAITAAITAGVTVVAAAGNNADGGETGGAANTVLDYPAAYDGVIAVGASALRDNNSGQFAGSTEYVAPYSQFGASLAVVAPGGDPGASDSSPLHWIWNYSTSTAAFASDKCTYGHGTLPVTPTNCTAFFAGTSQATPQVSAAAALLLSVSGHHTLTPAQITRILEDTADNINDPHQGHGRLNIYKALAAVTNDPTGAAYSGPSVQKTSPTQTVAFAYDNSGGTVPHILDVNYPLGVPVDSSGNFRLGDVPASATVYHVGVWYDANGNGIVDGGDQFGNPASTCSAAQKCTIGTITMHAVAAGFKLP